MDIDTYGIGTDQMCLESRHAEVSTLQPDIAAVSVAGFMTSWPKL